MTPCQPLRFAHVKNTHPGEVENDKGARSRVLGSGCGESGLGINPDMAVRTNGMGSWAALCTLLWLNLETAATLELTPEDERHPIEAALSSRGRQGWRASGLDRRPSVLSSISRSGSGESIWCSMRPRPVARTNSFFVGAQKPIKAFAKSCGSSGTSVRRTARERQRTTLLTFQTSHCLI